MPLILFLCLFLFRPNISLGPLSFMFVSDRSFKFRIGPLSFEFISDRSFLSTSVKPKLICPLSQSYLVGEKIDAKCQKNHLTHLTDISVLT